MLVSNIFWLYLCQVPDMLYLLSLKQDRIKMLCINRWRWVHSFGGFFFFFGFINFITSVWQIPSLPRMSHMLPWRDLGESPTIPGEEVRKTGAGDKEGSVVPQPTFPSLLNRGLWFFHLFPRNISHLPSCIKTHDCFRAWLCHFGAYFLIVKYLRCLCVIPVNRGTWSKWSLKSLNFLLKMLK